MKTTYIKALMSTVLVCGVTVATQAQGQKSKTITIINGDTTISETNVNEKEIAKMEKEINVTMSGDEKGNKKIVKKIIINEGKEGGEGMAYAYANGDEFEDVEVTAGENGETTIVIKRSDAKEGDGEKKIVKKDVQRDGAERNAAPRERNTMNVKMRVEKTIAKLEVETGSKEPLNISVLDENGKQVFYETHKTGGKYAKDIPLEKKGTYFLNLIQNKTSTMEKIIVE